MHGWAHLRGGVRMGVAKTMSDDSEGMMASFSSFSSCNDYREMTAFLMVLRLLANATVALQRG